MRAKPVRVVLAIYPSDAEQAKRARRALAEMHRSCLIESAEDQPTEFCRAFAPLRLEGESMLVVETAGAKVESVVKTIRSAGTPAIFVVRPDLGAGNRWSGRIDRKATSPSSATRSAILARLDEKERELNVARADLLEATRLDHALTPAAEWILDNSYLIHTQITEVNRHLPHDRKRRNNKRRESGIQGLAQGLLASTDYVLTGNNIRDALSQSQAQQPLSIAELWSFPLFLRVALIEALSHLATQVSEAQQLRELAYLWANRLAASARMGGEVFDRILHLLESQPVANQPYFITALAEQLQDEEIALAPVQRWIEERFHQPLLELVREQHTREAVEVVSTANAFGSLRTLARLEFPEIFEQVSLV